MVSGERGGAGYVILICKKFKHKKYKTHECFKKTVLLLRALLTKGFGGLSSKFALNNPNLRKPFEFV